MAVVQAINSSLLSYMHIIREPGKSPDPYDAFAIPTNVVEDVMRNQFSGDGSIGPSDHLYMIEARCSLFKLSGISQDDVKKKLFYVSLKGEARNWYHSLKHINKLEWEYLKKEFYPRYYSPIKAYGDRSHIYNFWPHP